MFIIAELQKEDNVKSFVLFMRTRNLLLCLVSICGLIFAASCRTEQAQTESPPQNIEIEQKTQPKTIADDFAYPIGKTEIITEAKDKKDEWYNAQDFGENNHLGEDWNKNSGGNTDCGEPVLEAANGAITYAENAGLGWGNVVIITHKLENGELIQTLYGHLQTISKTDGEVKKGEQIGTVGNADGKYLCHLHFELRTENCLMWNKAGAGYSAERNGWLNPSDFIDSKR